MTVAPPASFPGSRILAGWWRELASFHPRSLWVSYLGLHRIDGSVRVISRAPLGHMEALLLRFLRSATPANASPHWEQLSLYPAFLFGVVNGLASKGLVTRTGQGIWSLTAQGLHALTHGNYEQVHEERRVFPFLSAPDGASAHFVRLLREPPPAAAFPWPDPRFDLAHYQACFTQSSEWKRRCGFPENVIGASAGNETVVNGQQLLVDHAVWIALALVRTREGQGDGGLLGFWIEPGRWVLRSAEPAFHLVEGWQDAVPTLRTEPAPEVWRRTWQVWCQPRGLPPAEVERCSQQLLDYRLVVHAPQRLIERLQAARSDALKGDAWVLFGDGPVRRAALLEVREAGAGGRTVIGTPATGRTE